MAGLKTKIEILSHLFHSIDYNWVCKIEAAEAAQKWVSKSQSLQQNQESVLTYWWFDNFNQSINSHTRKRAMDSTHIAEFSERNDVHIASSTVASDPHSKHRSLAPSRIDLPAFKIDNKRSSVLSYHRCQKTESNKWTKKPSISMNFGCSEESFIKRSAFTDIFRIVCCHTNWSVG